MAFFLLEEYIFEFQQRVLEKGQNVRRLQAQRNELNSKVEFGLDEFRRKSIFQVRMLKEELQQLHEQGSYVGEVSKVMDKKKVLVKVRS